jgi:signal transduction histidine kinase
MVLVLLLCDGFEGTLLVLVAMQLAPRLPRRTGLVWIVTQSLLLGAAVAIHWSLRPALMLAPPYLGFQILAFLAVEALDREARANAELRAARELLAHGSRVAERLRIARELHDAVGHRLVALSLNLERASHQEENREAVMVSQSLTRRLLTDIGEIVDTLGRAERLDLRRSLEGLSEEIPRPRVHLSLPPDLAVEDPELAHLLLRCCQEIVTNAAKHAQAENLWLDVVQEGGAIEVRARDDGRGAAEVAAGRGLAGMRERLERAGGRLEVATRPGMGFAVAALVPLRRGA